VSENPVVWQLEGGTFEWTLEQQPSPLSGPFRIVRGGEVIQTGTSTVQPDPERARRAGVMCTAAWRLNGRGLRC
jgi:hypothetical protein